MKIKVTTTPYPFDQAEQALIDLAGERVHGAAVLSMAYERPARSGKHRRFSGPASCSAASR